MMANEIREYFRYYGHMADGSKVLILDTLDFYSNHSAIAMHVVSDTESNVDFVLDRKVKHILSMVGEENIAISKGYRQVIAMLVAHCLRKYKPFKILYISSKWSAWMEGFVQLLRQFHSDSRFFWLTQTEENSANCFINIKMPYMELLLPQNTFDIVVLDDTDESLLMTMKEPVMLSLCIQGKVIVLSKRAEIMDSFVGMAADRYELGDGWQIGHRLLSFEERAVIEADTMNGAVAVIVQEVLKRIMLVQETFLSAEADSDIDMDMLLQIAEEVEQYILLTYSALPSLEVKFLVNEWKRALLDCRLGWGQKENVRSLGEELLKVMH